MKMTKIIIAFVIVLSTTSGRADEVIGRYMAYIAEAPHLDDEGKTLATAADILKQDRLDQLLIEEVDGGFAICGDKIGFFKDPANRANFARMLERGKLTEADEKAIIKGDVLVFVDILRNAKGECFFTILVHECVED